MVEISKSCLVSVIILTWNSEKYIEKCINAVFTDATSSGIKIEVFVIDNGSTDSTIKILDKLRKKYPNLNIIKLERNYGTTISRNIAIRKSVGKYIFVLDSDTEVQPGVMKELIKTVESGKRIGIAAPRLIYENGEVQPSCKKFPTAKVKFLKYFHSKKFQEIAEKEELYDKKIYTKNFNKIVDVDYCISAAWMINRKALEEIGLLDERIFYAPEDVDYCLRMWLNGWRIVYNPKVSVSHYTQRISHKNFRMALVHAKGLIYYFLKYKYFFNRNRLYKRISKRHNRDYGI